MSRASSPGVDPRERARRMRGRFRKSLAPPGHDPRQLDLFRDLQTTNSPGQAGLKANQK
jgi:hypothetical protein